MGNGVSLSQKGVPLPDKWIEYWQRGVPFSERGTPSRRMDSLWAKGYPFLRKMYSFEKITVFSSKWNILYELLQSCYKSQQGIEWQDFCLKLNQEHETRLIIEIIKLVVKSFGIRSSVQTVAISYNLRFENIVMGWFKFLPSSHHMLIKICIP